MRFTPDFIQQLKERLSIVSVVGEVIPLRRAGRNFKGLCPFHQEKSPSFTVHEEKQIFHCFGCGAGGDVLQFVMQREGLTFPETVERLAARAGMELPSEQTPAAAEAAKQAAQHRKLLLRVNALAAEYYGERLRGPSGAFAREYLAGRGFAGDAFFTQLFLGAADDSWDGLATYLHGRGVPMALAEQVGLVKSRPQRAGYYDFFRRRVMFAIRDAKGEVIGFGGRVVPGAGDAAGAQDAKYLNSSDSPIFHKGDTLYGLPTALPAMREKNRVMVVEGYLDVLALQQAGFVETVAPLGTALTDAHIRWLARVTQNIVLCFDGDDAGRRAAGRALPLFLAHALIPRVVALPEGEDPDSWIRTAGVDGWEDRLSAAPTLFEWWIDGTVARCGRTTVGRVQCLEQLRPLFARLHDPVQKALYHQRLARALQLSDTVVAEALRGDTGALRTVGARAVAPVAMRSTSRTAPSRRTRVEQAILSVMLASPQAMGLMATRMTPADLTTPALQAVAEQLFAHYTAHGRVELSELLASLADPEIQRTMATLAFEAETYKDTADLSAVVEALLQQLATETTRAALMQAQQEISALGMAGRSADDGPDAALELLLQRKQQLQQDRQNQKRDQK